MCTKKVFKKSKKYANPLKDKEPDLLIFIVYDNRICKVIELKDGDAFDTKKSRAEKENLEEFSMKFGAKIPFATDYYICSFNQENKDAIKLGFKGIFDKEHIMTGKELCELLSIDYEDIIEKRKNDMEDNFDYFITELINILEVCDLLKIKLKEKDNERDGDKVQSK